MLVRANFFLVFHRKSHEVDTPWDSFYLFGFIISTTYPAKRRKSVAIGFRSGNPIPSDILRGSTSTVPGCHAYGLH